MSNVKIKITAGPEAFRLDLEHGAAFTTTGDLRGHPMPGIDSMNRGMLPEPYWTAAEDAVYAVYHYETPILWKVANGTWYVPMHSYSGKTSTYRNRMVDALKLFGAGIEEI